MGSIKKFGGKLKYNIFYKIWDNSCIIDPNIMSWSLLISETHFFLQAILLVISEKKKIPLQIQYENMKKRHAKLLGRLNVYIGLFNLNSYFQQSNWNPWYSKSSISILILNLKSL